MQFVNNGPDIPDALLQAHEEGRVVFFCGAGMSYPAGLPSFKGLVEQIYERNGTAPNDIERSALERGQYDATLDLLERRLPGQRIAVRRALADALKPKLRRKGATDTHAALLQLARDRNGALRLVTTNFDRVFQVAASRMGQSFEAHAAPMLPVPKNSRWNALVYLHGVLPEKSDDALLNRLVVTSGDFGLAYLTERWAARFVSELFRNYVVCFVGYSINDPVLRYMMDALAADRMQGEVTPLAWALGDCEPGQEVRKRVEWEAKGVVPILYPVSAAAHDHPALHQTLRAWAETYRDGVTGKERIVVTHALARPSASTPQDDFVGRMLWALSDPTGLPARRFAEFNPVPSLDWLQDALALERYGHADLAQFGVSPRNEHDPKLSFSLIHRPTPYHLASPMRLVADNTAAARWDDVMFQIARWLLRHMNDPRLVLWIAERGGQLPEQWRWQIEHRLDEIERLEQDRNIAELNDIRAHAPSAIPGPLMRSLWRLLLSGRVKSPWGEPDLYRWKERLKREGLTATLRRELRQLLSPEVRLRKPIRLGDEPEGDDENGRLRHLVDWELVLSADHVRAALRDTTDAQWQSALPTLLDDFQQQLRDALDLLHELGEANEKSDRSHWDLPSIIPHWQNRGFRDWTVLIELVRDAWAAVLSEDRRRAANVAMAWFDQPYPTFKRLAFYAASQHEGIANERWVEWLLLDGAWWLWAIDTRREVLRLLVLNGQQLTTESQQRLEAAVLAGPPRAMYSEDLTSDRWQDLCEHSVWLYVAKLAASGVSVGEAAASRLAELSQLHPEWQLAADERDEFSHWMSGTGDPDYEDHRYADVAPRHWRDLVQWLSKAPSKEHQFYGDSWRDVCRTRFFHSWFALCDLARQDVWPIGRWKVALQVRSEDGMVQRTWRYAAPLVSTMPEAILQATAHEVSWWLEAASKVCDRHQAVLWEISKRICRLKFDEGSGSVRGGDNAVYRPVAEAINHAIGRVTQAVINDWLNRPGFTGDSVN